MQNTLPTLTTPFTHSNLSVHLTFPTSSKAFKLPIPQSHYLPGTHKKINPIILIHAKPQQKQYNSKFNKTFPMRNHKYLSQVAAVGCLTDENLKRMNKSSLKIARSLEFDPYLCDASGLKQLGEAIKKLRIQITDVSLTIRKFNTPKEVDNVGLSLRRIRGLKKLKLELIGASRNYSPDMLKDLEKNIRRYYLLKALDIKLVYLENIKRTDYVNFTLSYAKLPKLDELKQQMLTNFSPKTDFGSEPCAIPVLNKIKRLLIRSSAKTGWTSMMDGSGQFTPGYFKYFISKTNPEHYIHRFNNYEVSTEAAEAIAQVVPQLANLRTLVLEFTNCQMGELELMVLAEGFMNCKQIKHLTFKFVERSPIALEVIGQFVKLISGLKFLESFEIFFGKLRGSPEERYGLQQFLSKATNVEYVMTKGSFHAFNKRIEI